MSAAVKLPSGSSCPLPFIALARRRSTSLESHVEALAQRVARQELRRAAEPIELAQFLHDEHKRFHSMIANIGGNRRLERLISDLQDETQRFWALLPDDQLVGRVFLADEAHAAILTAIATQDPAKARAAVVTHLRDGVQLMLDAVVPEYPPPEDLGA
jgi:DNA-binding GntR family transcriptional regulator